MKQEDELEILYKDEALDILYEFREILSAEVLSEVKEIEDKGNCIDITDIVYTRQDILNAVHSIIVMLDDKLQENEESKKYISWSTLRSWQYESREDTGTSTGNKTVKSILVQPDLL